MTTSKVLLHGAGAIGAIYVYILQQAGCEVTAVCRSNYSAAKKDGFTIDSGKFGKGLRIRPEVVRTPAEAAASANIFDYVIVSSKALPDAETAKTIAPAITKGKTCIVLIQNGIGIEDEYRTLFPENPLLSCVVYLPTTQTSPGHVVMQEVELIEIGTFPEAAYQQDAAARSAADEFVKLLKAGGSNAHFYEDIQERRWSKLLLNAPWNPICALTLSRDVAFLASSPTAENLIRDVMLEVVAVSQALGYKSITAASAREQLERAVGRIGGPGIEPSMLVDVLNERRMEAEVILGNPVRLSQSLGIAVPRMETLYYLTKALDESLAFREQGRSLDGLNTRKAQEQNDKNSS